MRLRTDCDLKVIDGDCFLTTEELRINLGKIAEPLILNLKHARESHVDLKKMMGCELFSQLQNSGLVIYDENHPANPLENSQYKWFSYLTDGNIKWDEYKDLNIAILGCGGIGSLACQSLAASGIENFLLLDFDKIEEDNLNRQFTYHRADIGKLKIEKLKKLLHTDYKTNKIKTFNQNIQSVDTLLALCNNANLLLCCADTPAHSIHLICSDFSIKTGIPVLYGAVGFMNGTIGPLLLGADAAMKYKKACQLVHPLIVNKYWALSFPSNGATNAIIANMIALEVMKFFIARKRCNVINRCLNFNFPVLETTMGYSIK